MGRFLWVSPKDLKLHRDLLLPFSSSFVLLSLSLRSLQDLTKTYTHYIEVELFTGFFDLFVFDRCCFVGLGVR